MADEINELVDDEIEGDVGPIDPDLQAMFHPIDARAEAERAEALAMYRAAVHYVAGGRTLTAKSKPTLPVVSAAMTLLSIDLGQFQTDLDAVKKLNERTRMLSVMGAEDDLRAKWKAMLVERDGIDAEVKKLQAKSEQVYSAMRSESGLWRSHRETIRDIINNSPRIYDKPTPPPPAPTAPETEWKFQTMKPANEPMPGGREVVRPHA